MKTMYSIRIQHDFYDHGNVVTDEDEDSNENQTDTTGIPTLNEAFSAIENSSRENVPYALHGSLRFYNE
ncbi:hypothetical protein QE152_g4200 [Popillia japonica]|uniref:Uncharacterized protein n=1 Tax=Popillia japonica TaxID=7064 RepID=A0AAW1N1J3_POPJA